MHDLLASCALSATCAVRRVLWALTAVAMRSSISIASRLFAM
ncbi:hypothetical protein F441_14582, partial [Phytophthora nicotianae CJ01A1]